MVLQRVLNVLPYLSFVPLYFASTYLVLSLGLVFFDDFDRETHAALLVLEVLRRALRKWELAVNFFVRI